METTHSPLHAAQGKSVKLKFTNAKLPQTVVECPPQYSFLQAIQQANNYTLLYLYTNYYLTHKKELISCYDLVSSIGTEDANAWHEIEIVLTPYDYFSARHHFEAVSEALDDPRAYHFRLTQGKRAHLQDIPKALVPPSFDGKAVLPTALLRPGIKAMADTPPQPISFVEYFCMSGFNPVPENAKLNGDLFYLHLKILEGAEYHITASPQGFYFNMSKVSCYNPAMHPSKAHFTCLFDLLSSVSEKYNKAMEKLLTSNAISALQFEQRQQQPHLNKFLFANEKWLDDPPQGWQWSKCHKREPQQSYYDWNENSLEFEQTAMEGARMLIDGEIFPLNPQDERKKQIYIYKRIFFSLASDTVMDHAQEKGEEATPSSSSINTDLINIQRVRQLQIKDLNVLQSVVVHYRGYKVIAQCIIPGLLSGEPNNCTQYGSLDDGNTIGTHPDFHVLMQQVCSRLHLEDVVQIKDGKGDTKIVASSPDVKGILGSNHLKYIVDLFRLSPRDLNYEGLQHESCVLRPQLIDSFISHHPTLPKINVNIGTSVKFVANQRTEEQKRSLKDMAEYLKTNAIDTLIEYICGKGKSEMTDSRGVARCLHKFGVNIRYLGYIHDKIRNHDEVKLVIRRIILVRSLKHLFKMAMRNTNILYLNNTLCHLLNCIFGRKVHQMQLSVGDVEHPYPQPPKKKKKKKKDQTVVVTEQSSYIVIQKSEYQTMRPQTIAALVNKISVARYNFVVGDSPFCSDYQKIATLRDVCLSVGLVLERKDYDIVENGEECAELPFNNRNILHITAASKRAKVCDRQLEDEVSVGDRAVEQGNMKAAIVQYEQASEKALRTGRGQEYCSIQSKLNKSRFLSGDYAGALMGEYQIMSLLQALGRTDSEEMILAYSRVGLYHMVRAENNQAMYFLSRSLMMMLACFGEGYPDILVNFANIARIQQQNKDYARAVEWYLSAVATLAPTYKTHVNISFCYSSLASLHYEMGQLKNCVDYQQDSLAILTKLFTETDTKVVDAKKILKVYKDQYEAHKNHHSNHPHPRQEKKRK